MPFLKGPLPKLTSNQVGFRLVHFTCGRRSFCQGVSEKQIVPKSLHLINEINYYAKDSEAGVV